MMGDPQEPAIRYTDDLAGLTAGRLEGGFFDGWPNRPSADRHLALLRGSEIAIVAIDDAAPGAPVVGFVHAIGDGVLTAFIPLLEVLPAYRGHGIGTELVRRVLERLRDRYSIDLICDDDVVPFYERLGGMRYGGMIWRNRDVLREPPEAPQA